MATATKTTLDLDWAVGSTIETVCDDVRAFLAERDDDSTSFEVVSMAGPGGGHPVVRFVGTVAALDSIAAAYEVS